MAGAARNGTTSAAIAPLARERAFPQRQSRRRVLVSAEPGPALKLPCIVPPYPARPRITPFRGASGIAAPAECGECFPWELGPITGGDEGRPTASLSVAKFLSGIADFANCTFGEPKQSAIHAQTRFAWQVNSQSPSA